MGFLPRVMHFKVAMYLSFMIGLWPYVTFQNEINRKIYEIMSKLHYVYFRLFALTQVIQLVVLLTAEEVNYGEVTNNLAILLVYLNSAVRCKVIMGKVIKEIINKVNNFEKKMWKDMDIGVIKIYKENAKRNTVFCTLFITNTVLICLLYTVWPFFVEGIIVKVDNVTVEVKHLPVSAWVPFDAQKHYAAAYILLLFNASYMGTMFFISTEVLAFGLMTYPIGQIRILKHILRNFRKYRDSMKRKMNLPENQASELQLRECILKHQDIIRYIEVFNDEMKHTYLLDFLQCSLQLTCILYRFLIQRNFALIVINLQFMLAMLIRLFITYWTANEITLQSVDVSEELYNMEWLEESVKIKRMILVMMMRGQRPLKLFIGAFKAMSLETFITIIKVTYSYISLFYRHQ